MEEWQRPFNIILFVTIISIAIVFLYGVYRYTEPFIPKEEEKQVNPEVILNETRYKMGLTFFNTENEPIAVYYVLKQGSSLQQEGYVEAGVMEYFNNATDNVTYSLIADNDDYYIGNRDCVNQNCSVILYKNAELILTGAEINPKLFKLIIDVSDGIAKNPLLCVHYSNIYNVSISSMNEITNPVRFGASYNSCYPLRYDLYAGQYFHDVKYEKLEGETEITFVIVDQGYDEIYNPTYEVDNEIPDVLFIYNLTKR